MKRIVSVWLPDWPITVWSRMAGRSSPPDDTPFALVEKGPHGLVLSATNRAARRLGHAMGQAHADAKAVSPTLITHPAEPDRDAEALRLLSLWAERYSPCVAMDAASPGREGLLIDMTGGAHLFGGEIALLTDMAVRLKAAGIPARLAMADTAGAAWALARFGPRDTRRLVPAGGNRTALAPLPVVALRLNDADVKLLSRLGLRTIGDLMALPRSGLARRFRGEAGLGLVRRLDQALGAEPEILEPIRRPPVWRVWRTVLEPLIDAPGIETVLGDLAPSLAESLERDGQGARRLTLTAFRTDGRATHLSVALSAPSIRPAHLVKVLKERGLEHLDLGFGADAVMLSADVVEPLTAIQSDLDKGRDGDQRLALAALLDRLGARLGETAAFHLEAKASWLPEHSQARRPAGEGPPVAAEPPPLPDRPLLLLDPPEPVTVPLASLPDGPPASFVWRRVTHRVSRAQGPERLSAEWWKPSKRPLPERTRDYYRVEDREGRRYWLFREGLYEREDQAVEPPAPGETQGRLIDRPPGWWMHGVFA
ncbi:DNA polymerase Y family protein [Caulobacter sp. NIBR1757]|uniref:Y-family DNA polymerase n=1 Tax=Caulobacter sp. NIBR1757 TaxID=3016000 RepID=UPI0022F07B54|nr:DNA polymerase Y family protein [Caulobacter sp. NIBR1757]